jgi:hypothetical protein
MTGLKQGWPKAVVEWLATQDEPVTLGRVARDALGVDSNHLNTGEYRDVGRVMFRAGWRTMTVWVPPSEEPKL